MDEEFTTIRILKSDRNKLEKTGLAGEPAWKTFNKILPETDEYNTLEAIKNKLQQDARERVAQAYKEKLLRKIEKNQTNVEDAKKLLGIDNEEGQKSGFWAKEKFNKKE
jgi:hypothetical protein